MLMKFDKKNSYYFYYITKFKVWVPTIDNKDIKRYTWPQTYDGYSALHTQHSMYLNGEILSEKCES